MNTSRLILGATLLCAQPVFAQPELKTINGLSYPLVSPEEALRLQGKEKPITLHLHDVTLRDAFGELAKQSGMRFGPFSGTNVDRALDTKLSIDTETRSFKEAFRAIIEKANVSAQMQRLSGSSVASVIFGARSLTENTPVSGQEPFEVRLQSVNYTSSRSVRLGKIPQRDQNSNFSVSLAAELGPQVRVMGSGRIRVTRAEDEQGHSLQLAEIPFPFDLRFSLTGGSPLNISLKTPEVGSRKLSHLEGVIIYVVPIKYDTWELPDVLTAKDASHEFKGGGKTVRMTIEHAYPSENSLEVGLNIRSPLETDLVTGGIYSQFSVDQLTSSLGLKDANGQGLGRGGYSTGVGKNGSTTVELHFGLIPPTDQPFINQNGKMAPVQQTKLTAPISLSLNVAVEFVQIEVPFSFSNIPLP